MEEIILATILSSYRKRTVHYFEAKKKTEPYLCE